MCASAHVYVLKLVCHLIKYTRNINFKEKTEQPKVVRPYIRYNRVCIGYVSDCYYIVCLIKRDIKR